MKWINNIINKLFPHPLEKQLLMSKFRLLLHQHNAYPSFMHYCGGSQSKMDDFLRRTPPSKWVMLLPNWRNTREGFDFWWTIHQEWKKIRQSLK